MELRITDLLKIAVTPQMFNEQIIVANAEQKKFIGQVRKFTLKARGAGFQVSFQEGQSNTNFVLLADGVSYNEDLLLTSETFMIFFQSTSILGILEIITWQ
jgi:hypothetical protein